MKKIVLFAVMLCMLLSLVACAGEKDTAPEITLQEVYDAGKTLDALLGDHESVYVQVTSNGSLLREEYLSKQYYYAFQDAEYMNMGFDYASFTTDLGEYVCFDGLYSFYVMVTPDGMMDTKDRFDEAANNAFVSTAILSDTFEITEADGSIIVTCTADIDDITLMDEGIVSCVETYTLDAKTREMTAVKTVYTYEDGTVEEGVVTITRDVECPEGMKPFLALAEAGDMRTVTLVSNPGAENEKTDSVQAPRGVLFGVASHWNVEETLSLYTDAACTQPLVEEPDVNFDLTLYVKWGE